MAVTIIIEGPNLSGKSTLSKALSERLGIPVVHNSKPEDGFRDNLKFSMENKENIILDRHHLGEVVYPALKRDGRQPLELWEQHMIERVLESKGTILILCSADLQFRLQKFDERGEDFVTKNELKDEGDLFEDAFNRSLLSNKFDYRLPFTDEDKTERFLDFIEERYNYLLEISEEFEEYEHQGYLPSDPYSEPTAVIIGDSYGDKTSVGSGTKRAFVSPIGSSRHLAQALAMIHRPTDKLYITNAWKYIDNREVSRQTLVEELYFVGASKCPIIVLGYEAKKALDGINTDGLFSHYTFVNHPQFEFRFKNKEIGRYAKALDIALGVNR